MFIEWSTALELCDPVVDSEHRYLLGLINNLHEQYESGALEENLSRVFMHLAKYVRVHFENEEALMAAVGYPELNAHKAKHRKLVEQAMVLSEEYMDGSDTVTEETLQFLKEWALNHISESDMKIRDYLSGERPAGLTMVPAFAETTGPDFKKCTLCGKIWHTFDDLRNDKTKVLKGCQPDLTNHLYNLIMYNCTCDTTLAMFLKEFVPCTDIPFAIDENPDPHHRREGCLKTDPTTPCLEKCACTYTNQILSALG